MLENATVAISAKPPTAARENPAVEYSNAANIACSKSKFSFKQHMWYHTVLPAAQSHQPAGEGVRLEGFCMPYKEYLVLGSVGAHIAKQLEECIPCVLRQNPLSNGV